MPKHELMSRTETPLRGIMEVQRSFGRLMDDLFEGHPVLGRFGRAGEEGWIPEIDVLEDENEYTVRASLPGVDKKDIEVEVSDGTLTLRGQRKELTEVKGRNWLRREQCVGGFLRTVELPAGVDASRVRATDKDGILEIRLPKTERAKARKVSIE